MAVLMRGDAPKPARKIVRPVQESAIRVEYFQGPALLISGEDDPVWCSSDMAAEIESRLSGIIFLSPLSI